MDHTTVPALVDYLAQIPEYRARRGTQHPLLALLLLVSVATLCGARGQSGHRRLGAHHGQPLAAAAGLHPGPPARASRRCSRLFARIPYKTVEAALGRWAEQALRLLPGPARRAGGGRGGRQGAARQPAAGGRGGASAQLRSASGWAWCWGRSACRTRPTRSARRASSCWRWSLEGRVVTADALLTQREVARTILASGGDYLLAVKENQPTCTPISSPPSRPPPTPPAWSGRPAPSRSTAGGSSIGG